MNRRNFLKLTAVAAGSLAASPLVGEAVRAANGPTPELIVPMQAQATTTKIAFVKTTNRAEGVRQALALLGINPVKGKSVFIKPNFNSADATPGSTHLDVLRTLVQQLGEMGARGITVGDRSGMGVTRQVMEQLNVFNLARDLKYQTVVFDALKASDWKQFQVQGGHWNRGFALPLPMLNAEAVVSTCCLKTHGYGGHFTLSLKNSVGLAAKVLPGQNYNYMAELHGSAHQRRMIAEINTAYTPALIVLDGVQAFVDGGPDRGKLVDSGVILAGTDRVAIDAVGVAILRYFGTNNNVGKGAIFAQEQIARAVELGLGVSGPKQIELVTSDTESAAYASKIRAVLDAA